MDNLVWYCQTCGNAVEDGTGSIRAPYSEITALGAVRWRITHRACADPEAEDYDGYDIAIGRLRTPADLLHWDEHLSAKRWVPRSDWATIVSAHTLASVA
jgi:hypothetical protein